MKRPYLMNFMAIRSEKQISIRATVTDSTSPIRDTKKASSPIQSIGFMKSDEYRVKIVGLSAEQKEIFVREYDSDSFGNFEIKIPDHFGKSSIKVLQIYEVSYHEGLLLLLGTFLPYEIHDPKKIIVCDFDKTLVDTKFSSAKEVFNSLKKPLTEFPNIEGSIDLLKQHMDELYQPFILSASPHFYENALRDWFYQNQIYADNIFLKDYRKIFSFSDSILTTKDMKNQGFYKLNQLVTILLMTGIPRHLVLVGDGFEADSYIYLCLYSVLVDRTDPWTLWNRIKKEKGFKLTSRQNSQFLSKFYQLSELTNKIDTISVKIFIRCNSEIMDKTKNKSFKLNLIEKNKAVISYYLA
jgi:hypothetical protein